jgi:glycosyltransferase involved in cell wall biosynthesis
MSALATSSETAESIPVDLVHIIGAFAAGGAERFVVDLVRALQGRGWQSAVLALSAREDATRAIMEEQLRACGVSFAVGPTVRLGVRTVAWYGRRVSRLRPGIVHLHTANTELAHLLGFPWHRNRFCLVRTLHNTRLSLRTLESVAMRTLPVAHSIACSEAARQANFGQIKGSLVTIRNGVRFGWPARTRARSEAAKRSLGLKTDRTHFLCIGRMDGPSLASSQKGHDLLLEAWRRSSLGARRARLHLVGGGPLRSPLERSAADLAGVSFHGVRPDVPDWLTAADCLVMPSRWEGMPIVGIEAAGTGIACIFSDIEPLRELGAPAARFFACGDPDQLAQRLREFHELPEAPPAAAVEVFRLEFGIDRTVDAYDRIYRSILSTAPRAGGSQADRSRSISD